MVALTANAPYHGKLSVALICDPNISDGAKTLYSYIWASTFASPKPPTRDEMATGLHVTPVTVTNRLRELVKNHWIAVWDGIVDGRISNVYAIFQSQDECQQFISENPALHYIAFKGLEDLKRKSRAGKGGKKRNSDNQIDNKPEFMINPSLPLVVNSSIPDTYTQVYPISAHSYKRENIKEINTDISNEISMQPDQTPQSYHMVSDHVDDSDEMVKTERATIPTDNRHLGESAEEPPSKVALKVSPSVRKVNKHGTTVIRPRDPLFDSVARLQFGIDDTVNLPRGFGARIQRIVTVIVDAYKQRNNVTQLSPQEREGLAGIHARFWEWYTTVKYPTRGNEPPNELKSDVKFAEYWLEYRSVRNAPKAESPQDVIPIARVGITTELPKPGGKWGGV